MCGGSPLILSCCCRSCCRCIVTCRGDYTQGRGDIILSFSPLNNLSYWMYLLGVINCRGDSQGSMRLCTLVLPSLNRIIHSFTVDVLGVKDVGENHRSEEIFNTLVLPLWTEKCHVFNGPKFDHFLATFKHHWFCHGLSAVWWYA